jgi:hypothetical protein
MNQARNVRPMGYNEQAPTVSRSEETEIQGAIHGKRCT